MSLFGSLFSGVSALSSQSQSLGMISNNIANVNTTGYKRVSADFSNLVTASSRSGVFSPGGVRAIQNTTVDQQGLLQQSNSTTDVAVSGQGFFVVRRAPEPSSEPLYTRAGSFSEDNRGLLRNSAGFYLMGWPLDANGNIPAASSDVSSLQPVDVAFLGGLTRPTSDVEFVVNLDSRQDAAAPGPHFTRAVRVFDSLGQAQQLTLEFTRSAAAPARTWDLLIRDTNGNSLGTTPIEFGGDGRLTLPAAGANGRAQINLPNIDWGTGSDTQTIDVDITDFSMFSGEYNVVFVDQNGAELGLRTGVSVDEEGFVVASFSNGQTSRIYKVPLATFSNVNGLEGLTGTVYRQTIESGDFNLREPGEGGSGVIAPSSLEASNVDLADEFTRMIVTQRAYSAGTKVITTSDQMLQELMNLR